MLRFPKILSQNKIYSGRRMEKKLFTILIILLFFSILSRAEDESVKPKHFPVRFTGRLRDDFIAFKVGDDYQFMNLLETRLILRQKTDKLRFYFDLRGYWDFGDTFTEFEDIPQLPSPQLMRLFWRFYKPEFTWTFGKTYINFGNAGTLNIFEMEKEVNMTDLSYDKAGIFSLVFDLPLGEMSGIKTYLSGDSEGQTGICIFDNKFNFDYGAVLNRKNKDVNITGVYFKGDIEIGINGSWGYHFDDDFVDKFHEATLGFDYSYKSAVFSASFYYNEIGASKEEDYSSTIPNDTYFIARNYMFNSLMIIYDEFLSFGLNNFINLVDGSSIIIPFADYTISNKLYLNAQIGIVTGTDRDEFSKDTLGDFSILLRLDYKF